MFGWLKAAVTIGLKIYGFVAKAGDKPSLADALPFAVGQLLPAIQKAIQYQGLDTKEKFDRWLATVDAGTGSEATAIDLIATLPADKEEAFFDHLIEAGRIYGYHLIGVEGYRE